VPSKDGGHEKLHPVRVRGGPQTAKERCSGVCRIKDARHLQGTSQENRQNAYGLTGSKDIPHFMEEEPLGSHSKYKKRLLRRTSPHDQDTENKDPRPPDKNSEHNWNNLNWNTSKLEASASSANILLLKPRPSMGLAKEQKPAQTNITTQPQKTG
jgi:hypothetical protein